MTYPKVPDLPIPVSSPEISDARPRRLRFSASFLALRSVSVFWYSSSWRSSDFTCAFDFGGGDGGFGDDPMIYP